MASIIEVARLLVPVTGDATQLKRELGEANGSAQKFAASVAGLGKIAAVGFGAVAAAAGGAALGLFKLAQKATPIAGVMSAFNIQAGRAGLSLEDMREAAQGTLSDFELMLQANVALTGAGEELGKEFGKNLPRLLAGAQAAARAQGKSMDYMFSSIVTGIKRVSPMLIDNTGLVLKIGETNAKFAAKMGIAVDAMTAEQKQLAILEATLEATDKMAAQFGGGQLTVAQQTARLGVTIKNTSDKMGLALLPALGNVTSFMGELANKAAPHLVRVFEDQLGPALDGLTKMFVEFANSALGNTDAAFGGIADRLTLLAKNALVWGYNFITEFAVGMIRGASTSLTVAMNAIGSLLTFWMAPGSPPRIASDIDKWGMETIAEWLRGFGQADFSALSSFQAKLGNALQTLVGAGDLKAPEAAELLTSLSVGMAKALDEFKRTGAEPVELFERIRKAGGMLGDELAELARRQFTLAKASQALRDAQKKLAGAEETRGKAQGALTQLIGEYTKMQREGADAATLAAKRAQIEVAKDQVRASEASVKAAEQEAEAAEAQLDPERERLSLQEMLVDQLTKLVQLQTKATEALAVPSALGAMPKVGAIKAPKLAKMEPLVIPTELTAPDTSPVIKATSAARRAIEHELLILKGKLKKLFYEEINPAIWSVRLAWYRLTRDFEKFWNDPSVVAIRTWFAGLFPEGTVESLGEFAGVLLTVAIAAKVLSIAFGLVSAIFTVVVSPLGALLVALSLLYVLIRDYGPQVYETLQQLGFIVIWAFTVTSLLLRQWWEKIKLFFVTAFNDAIEGWRRFFSDMVEGWRRMKEDALELVRGWLNDMDLKFLIFKIKLGQTIENLRMSLLLVWYKIKTKAIELWDGLKTGVEEKVDAVKAYVEEKIEAVRTFIEEFSLKSVGEALIDSLKSGIAAKAQSLIDKARGVVNDAIAAARRLLGMGSPSKVFIDIGENMMRGLTLGLSNMKADVEMETRKAVFVPDRAVATARANATGRGGIIVHNHFGADSVRDDHDIYRIAELIERSLNRRSLQRVSV